jgi:hypothetical protein
MKMLSILVAVLLLPLSNRAQESDSSSRSVRLDLKPMPPPIPMKLADISLMTPMSVDYQSSIEQRSQLVPSLIPSLIAKWTVSPKQAVNPSMRDGITTAEQLNVRALRIYQRKVEEKFRSLSPVMPVLYPPPLERNNLPIER